MTGGQKSSPSYMYMTCDVCDVSVAFGLTPHL